MPTATSRAGTEARVPMLQVRGLTKRYGSTSALADVNLEVHAGEALALLGRNGAGKSTLIKLLAGVERADAGAVSVDGEALDPRSSDKRLAFIHQDLGLIDSLTVAENMAFVAGYPRNRRLISWPALRRRTQNQLDRWAIDVSPTAVVGSLDPASRAMVAITRALSTDARCIVLDEPTASLPESEVERLLDAVQAVKRRGVGIIYVTHRLAEVARVADTFLVLRNGRVAHQGKARETPRRTLVEYVVGAEAMPVRRTAVAGDTVVLQASGVTGEICLSVDLTVRNGEVLALVGLAGAGQSEMARILAGLTPPLGGQMVLAGRGYAPGDVPEAQRRGVVFLPGDRVREASIAAFDCTANFHLRKRGTAALVRPARERRAVLEAMHDWDIVPARVDARLSALSGGNQQKLLVAKWMSSRPIVFIAEEPTAGVDVGARAAIHQRLRDAAAAGRAIVVVSSDSEEVAELADRALVFRAGRVACQLTGPQLTENAIAAAAMHDQTPTEVTTP